MKLGFIVSGTSRGFHFLQLAQRSLTRTFVLQMDAECGLNWSTGVDRIDCASIRHMTKGWFLF